MDRSLPPVPRTTFPTFSHVEQSVLDMLRRESGFACWGVARIDGDGAAVVACAGEALGLAPGVRLRPGEVPFARAVAGEGPALCADAGAGETCRAYAAWALGPDSVLFGLDARPRESLAALEPLVREAAAVLATLRKADSALSRIARAAANDIAEGQARLAARITQMKGTRTCA